MDAVVEEAGVGDVGQEIRAPAALLPPGIQEPINIVDGKPEFDPTKRSHLHYRVRGTVLLTVGGDKEVLSAR